MQAEKEEQLAKQQVLPGDLPADVGMEPSQDLAAPAPGDVQTVYEYNSYSYMHESR